MADLWNMPASTFKLFMQAKDGREEVAQAVFNRVCSTQGDILPVDVELKLALTAPQALDGDIEKCFNRIVTSQTAPFGTLPQARLNRLVRDMFELVKERELEVQNEYVLACQLDLENIQNLVDYKPELFFKIGHGASFGKRHEELARKMQIDIKDHNFDFKNIGPFYNPDSVDLHKDELAWFVNQRAPLASMYQRFCAQEELEGERAKNCASMRARFENLKELKKVADDAHRHFKNKKESYIANHGKTPSRKIASED